VDDEIFQILIGVDDESGLPRIDPVMFEHEHRVQVRFGNVDMRIRAMRLSLIVGLEITEALADFILSVEKIRFILFSKKNHPKLSIINPSYTIHSLLKFLALLKK